MVYLFKSGVKQRRDDEQADTDITECFKAQY